MTSKTYLVHVAVHELLGHGVGKHIYEIDGKCPYQFTDPISGETFSSCYRLGETWNSKFGQISNSYEECRADTAGLYLSTLPEVYSIFDITDSDELLYVNTLQ